MGRPVKLPPTASELKELGVDADTVNLNRTETVEWHHYDRVVIGASIRYGHFHPALDRFVKSTGITAGVAGAFFSVNLVARKPEKRTRKPTAIRASFSLTRRGSRRAARYLPVRCVIRAIAGTIE